MELLKPLFIGVNCFPCNYTWRFWGFFTDLAYCEGTYIFIYKYKTYGLLIVWVHLELSFIGSKCFKSFNKALKRLPPSVLKENRILLTTWGVCCFTKFVW